MNVRRMTPSDPEWPERLSELGGLPVPSELFVTGLPLDADRTHIAIVGTRRPTVSGIETAETMARAFAEAGFVVVSGLAVGIDAAAHRACLEAGGTTVAVLGAGLDSGYPRTNRRLRSLIEQRGTVLTEYALGVEPRPHHFPERNRIVAGLAHAVVVVEGGEKSGSLITARFALDCGREVFAVPGGPRNTMASAPNDLIRTSQAALASRPEHVFEVIAPAAAWSEPAETLSLEPQVDLDDDELGLLLALDDVPASPDRIASTGTLPPGRVMMILAKLEVRGFARKSRSGFEITSTGAKLHERALDGDSSPDRSGGPLNS